MPFRFNQSIATAARRKASGDFGFGISNFGFGQRKVADGRQHALGGAILWIRMPEFGAHPISNPKSAIPNPKWELSIPDRRESIAQASHSCPQDSHSKPRSVPEPGMGMWSRESRAGSELTGTTAARLQIGQQRFSWMIRARVSRA